MCGKAILFRTLVAILYMMALPALKPLLRVLISTSHLGLRYLQMLPF